ncbi:MAG TPA: hypothetical protein VIK28_07440, partial [Sedimentisphaerales bacterium]
FAAILHARSRIQGVLAEHSQSRFCPVINIHKDENFKKSLEIMKLIDGLAAEFKDKDSVDQEHD